VAVRLGLRDRRHSREGLAIIIALFGIVNTLPGWPASWR
jgi:hypothetical protein